MAVSVYKKQLYNISRKCVLVMAQLNIDRQIIDLWLICSVCCHAVALCVALWSAPDARANRGCVFVYTCGPCTLARQSLFTSLLENRDFQNWGVIEQVRRGNCRFHITALQKQLAIFCAFFIIKIKLTTNSIYIHQFLHFYPLILKILTS